MPNPTELSDAFEGDVYAPRSPGYDAVRRPANPAFAHVRPRLIAACRSEADVAAAVRHAAATGQRLAPRGGGHCFAGRSSTDGIVLDLSALDGITVTGDGTAVIGAGARLGRVYAELGRRGRTLPAGCGPTVGIAGLTLGGGIGLLGRVHGLTCDRLTGARVVLAGGRVVDCDGTREPDLFWALRGAGGGQFGVVTSLRFATVPEPATTRVEMAWPPGTAYAGLVEAWQRWAPDAPDALTANLTLTAEPGVPVHATLAGASTLGEEETRKLLREFAVHAGTPAEPRLHDALPFGAVKDGFADPREDDERPVRIRSEFFDRTMPRATIEALLTRLAAYAPGDAVRGRRQLTFTAMGGAYNRVPAHATAFAHRGTRYLLEHIAEPEDAWSGRSRAIAAACGTGRVYPNFPDPDLPDPAAAYHAGNRERLAEVKRAYDPGRFFDFHQAI